MAEEAPDVQPVQRTPARSPYWGFVHGYASVQKPSSDPTRTQPRRPRRPPRASPRVAPLDAFTAALHEHQHAQDAASHDGSTARIPHFHGLQLPTLCWTQESVPEALRKYWSQRYLLFTQFDHGILIDEAGWYSVTPERIAWHIAQRCHERVEMHASVNTAGPRGDVVVVDAFCGVGGNAIQFAKFFPHVIAIDLDPVRLFCARENARIYGVADRIEFILGDALNILPTLTYASVIFLSPPWGGPSYLSQDAYRVDSIPGMDFPDVIRRCRTVTQNLVLFMPRNLVLPDDDPVLANGVCEVEYHRVFGKDKSAAVYFGDLVVADDEEDA